MKPAIAYDEPPLLASYRRAGDRVDCYRVWAEGPVLYIEGRGHWDLEAAQAYTTDIVRIVADLRLLRPALRAIVDRSVAPSYEPGVQELLVATYEKILRAGDRIAMLVDSSLVKARFRQITGREETQTFLSMSAALTWVMAYG